MILYEDAALVVLDKPAGLSSEEGVPARYCLTNCGAAALPSARPSCTA